MTKDKLWDIIGIILALCLPIGVLSILIGVGLLLSFSLSLLEGEQQSPQLITIATWCFFVGFPITTIGGAAYYLIGDGK